MNWFFLANQNLLCSQHSLIYEHLYMSQFFLVTSMIDSQTLLRQFLLYCVPYLLKLPVHLMNHSKIHFIHFTFYCLLSETYSFWCSFLEFTTQLGSQFHNNCTHLHNWNMSKWIKSIPCSKLPFFFFRKLWSPLNFLNPLLTFVVK